MRDSRETYPRLRSVHVAAAAAPIRRRLLSVHRRYCDVSAADHVVDRREGNRLGRLSALAHPTLILGILSRVRMEHRLHRSRSQRSHLLPDTAQAGVIARRHIDIRRDARRLVRVVHTATVHGDIHAERRVRARAESAGGRSREAQLRLRHILSTRGVPSPDRRLRRSLRPRAVHHPPPLKFRLLGRLQLLEHRDLAHHQMRRRRHRHLRPHCRL